MKQNGPLKHIPTLLLAAAIVYLGLAILSAVDRTIIKVDQLESKVDDISERIGRKVADGAIEGLEKRGKQVIKRSLHPSPFKHANPFRK